MNSRRDSARNARNRARRDVFFETIGPAHRPLVHWYLARGDRVFVFDFTYRMRRQPWLRRLFDRGAVTRIFIDHSPAASDAIAAAAALWPRFARHPLARAMARVHGANEVEPVLTWALLVSLFRFYFMRRWLTMHQSGPGRGRTIVVVPETIGRWTRELRTAGVATADVPSTVVTPWAPRAWSVTARRAEDTLRGWLQSARNAARLALTWWGRRRRVTPERPRRFDHVYSVDQPFQVKFRTGRSVDFLLDGVQLTVDNTALVVHPSAEGPWMHDASAMGFTVERRRDLQARTAFHRRPALTPRLGDLAAVVALAAIRIDAPAWLAGAANVGVTVTLTESMLLERLHFANYVYTNQDDLVRRWQNVMVRRFNRQSWTFMLSMSAGYVMGPGNDHWLWAFQNADHFVGQSRHMLAYQQGQHQAIAHYHNVGNIWSEGVAAAEAERVRREWFGDAARDGKVVAWFDTTFIEAENSPSTFGDAIAWYTEAQRLLDEDPGLLLAIKPSKSAGYFIDEASQWFHPLGFDVVRAWEALRRHPRVHFAGHDVDPALVIAVSDVTVTCALSSPTAEALGAGRRAFWYDPSHRWKGSLYDVHPLLFAHGPEELRATLRQLLYAMNDGEYAEWRNSVVRGLVEDDLDGKALTRFRALLAGEAERLAARPPERV